MEYLFGLLVITAILIICKLNRKKLNVKKDNRKRFDLIIKFNTDKYVDIRSHPKFIGIAEWKRYGKSGFRGFSLLNKEDTEKFILEHLNLCLNDFEVIKANIGLYLPS